MFKRSIKIANLLILAGMADYIGKRIKIADEYTTLYHIGERPARPVPLRPRYLDRFPGKKDGVFLSDKPEQVINNHGIKGNIYAYKVPNKTIKEMGGLKMYAGAREIVITKNAWENSDIKFLGSTKHDTFSDEIKEKYKSQTLGKYPFERYPSKYLKKLSELPFEEFKWEFGLLFVPGKKSEELENLLKKIYDLSKNTPAKELEKRKDFKNLMIEIAQMHKRGVFYNWAVNNGWIKNEAPYSIYRSKSLKLTASSDLEKNVKQLLPKLTKIAQKEYDEWDEDNIDEYAGGGICHIIADKICEFLNKEKIDCATYSSNFEQHVFTIAYDINTKTVIMIDLPYDVYETGGGFSWKKIKNVKIQPKDFVIYKLSWNDFFNENNELIEG